MSLMSLFTLLQTGQPVDRYRGGQLTDLLSRIDQTVSLVDVILPFLLIFTIIFAVLQKSKILGDGKKNFNVVVALVMALMVVLPHIFNMYTPNRDIVLIINTALPQISLVAVAIVMVLLLLGIWGADVKLAGQSLPAVIAAISAIIVIYIFGNAAGILPQVLPGGLHWSSPAVQMTIIILVFGIVIWFITKEETPEDEDKKPNKLVEELSKTLTGGGK